MSTKKKRNIKFHFDVFHGDGNLDLAIDLLDEKNRDEFRNFVNSKTSFNPHNMFICKNKDILKNYYDALFPWLERCEKEFGFRKLKGYDQQRLYAYLAERYLSYWFKRHTKFKELPWTIVEI